VDAGGHEAGLAADDVTSGGGQHVNQLVLPGRIDGEDVDERDDGLVAADHRAPLRRSRSCLRDRGIEQCRRAGRTRVHLVSAFPEPL
jgi:hypothetical protein